MAWENLLERIEMFLTLEEKSNNCLIIMDSKNRLEDARITEYAKKIKKDGVDGVPINHLVEDVFFVRSDTRNLIPSADVAAFCTRQHMYDNSDIRPYWKLLESKL